MARGRAGMNVQLMPEERALIERVTSLFPPGYINPSRVARLAIQAGIGQVEANLRAAARAVVDGDHEDGAA